MSDDLRDELARVAADVIWRIHGPESTDRESAEMDGSDVANALLPVVDRRIAQARTETAEEALRDESMRLRQQITMATEARDSFDRGTDPWADFNRQILAMTKSANELMLSADRIRQHAEEAAHPTDAPGGDR